MKTDQDRAETKAGDTLHTLNESGILQTSEERRIQFETKMAILRLQHPEEFEAILAKQRKSISDRRN